MQAILWCIISRSARPHVLSEIHVTVMRQLRPSLKTWECRNRTGFTTLPSKWLSLVLPRLWPFRQEQYKLLLTGNCRKPDILEFSLYFREVLCSFVSELGVGLPSTTHLVRSLFILENISVKHRLVNQGRIYQWSQVKLNMPKMVAYMSPIRPLAMVKSTSFSCLDLFHTYIILGMSQAWQGSYEDYEVSLVYLCSTNKAQGSLTEVVSFRYGWCSCRNVCRGHQTSCDIRNIWRSITGNTLLCHSPRQITRTDNLWCVCPFQVLATDEGSA